MAWKITAPGGRWLDYDGHHPSGDPATLALLTPRLGLPVSRGTSAGFYDPTGPDDPIGIWLHARDLLPPGVGTVTGAVPEVPPVPGGDPSVVY